MRQIFKNTKNRKMILLVLSMLGSIAFAFLIEFVFNWNALRNPLAPVELVKENEKSKIYEWQPKETVYVKELKITGDFPTDAQYQVYITYQNEFGVEKEETLTDCVYSVFAEAYTRIEKRVTSIKVEIPLAENEIDSISVSTRPEINKYRLLFFAFLSFLFAILVSQKELLLQKTELFFGLYALGFGCLLILYIGPRYNTWDEDTHFRNVYAIASNQEIDWSNAAWKMYQKYLPDFNTKAEKAMLKNYLNEQGTVFHHAENRNSLFLAYNVRGYLPMAFLFLFGKKTGMSFSDAYMFGKLGNLFLYVFLCMLAIKIVKFRKMIFASVAMLPTVVYQGAVYTYDNVVFSFLILGIALWINELSSKEMINRKRVIGIICCFLFGSFSKAVYIPVLLLLLLFSKEKFNSKRERYFFNIGIICLFLLMLSTFILPTLNSVATGNLSFGADSRGGETSVVLQLLSMIHHPVSTVRLFLKEIFSFDNFRNLGYAEADNVNWINLLGLNLATLGTLKEKWGSLLLIFLSFLFGTSPENEEESLVGIKRKIQIGVILFMIVGLIWMALYLSFTVVGEFSIKGVQARYYLPILVLISFVTWNQKIQNKLEKINYYRIVMIGMTFFMGLCVYNLALKPKLF